jgi:hypothetical protein
MSKRCSIPAQIQRILRLHRRQQRSLLGSGGSCISSISSNTINSLDFHLT